MAFRSFALPEFWKCYESLPVSARALADTKFALFEDDPFHPSLGLKQKGEVWTAMSAAPTVPSRTGRATASIGSGSALTRPTITCSLESGSLTKDDHVFSSVVVPIQRKRIGRIIWMSKTPVSTESYRESLLESLKNPDEAVQYLNACLEDNDARVFLLALRDVAEARGGIRSLSRDAHLNRESLYRMLSKNGNPSLNSLSAVLNACGLRLAVQSTAPRRRKRRIA